MDLSIVIPVSSDLRIVDCIRSVDEDVEIVVSLNKPTNALKQALQGYTVTLTEIDEANLSKAYNEGIAKAKYENILLMDSDCVFEKGAIRKIFNGLEGHALSKGVVVFQGGNWMNNIVAKVRAFSTSDDLSAFSPPLAFKKSIVNEIGYYFDPDLIWEEDLDFDQRVKKAKLKINWIKDGLIYHPKLSFKQDLRSAYNYGRGHGIGLYKGIYKENKLPKEIKKKMNKVIYAHLRETKGLGTDLYFMVWKKFYRKGIKDQLKLSTKKSGDLENEKDCCHCTTS